VRTDPDAFAAVDAARGVYDRVLIPDPDSLGRAVVYAGSAAFALLDVQGY
jgi:hypothetical protein